MKTINNRQLVVNFIVSMLVFLIQFFINFFLSPFIVEKLGEEAYGFFSLANDFTQYATLIAVSVNSMASRFISIEYNRGKKEEANKYFASVFWMNVFFSLVIIIIFSLVIVKLEKIISDIPNDLIRDVKLTFVLCVANLLVSFLSTCYIAVPFAVNRVDLYSYIQIFVNLIKLIIIIILFSFFLPHIYYLSIAIFLAGISSFVLLLQLKKKLVPEFSISIVFFQTKKVICLAKAGLWIFISDISSLLLNGLDLLIANAFVNSVAMSRISVAKQVPIAIGSLLGSMTNVFTASFTRLIAKEDKGGLLTEIRFTLKALGLFLTVPFAGLIIFGIDFFNLWLPQNIYFFSDIKQIYTLMILTLLNVIVNAYMYSIHSLFIALNKVKVYSIMVLISGIISTLLTLFIVSITSLGAYAISGTSTFVLGLVNLIIVPCYAEHVLEIHLFGLLKTIYKSYFVLFLTCILFYLMKKFLVLDTWLKFGASVSIVGILGYLLNFFVFLDKKERIRIKSIIKLKLQKWGILNIF